MATEHATTGSCIVLGMRRTFALVCLCLVSSTFVGAAGRASAPARKTLDFYFIDVEGGQATLVVTPAGQTLLIDAGYAGRGGRDQERVLAAARDAGVGGIDYLLVTHFHPDHVGGVPELAARIPIGTFVDYDAPLGTDRMTRGSFAAYAPVRDGHPHLVPKPGDRLLLDGIDATIVSAGGTLLAKPLRGAGRRTEGCAMVEEQIEDGTENYRSVGVRLRHGKFRFLDIGDLSGHTLVDLFCPTNLVGEVSVYLVAHHGNYDTNVPAFVRALRPRVAVMNNGVTKGGDPAALSTLRRESGLDLWQLHASWNEGAINADEMFIANVDDGQTGYWIKLEASRDGSFVVTNGRTGVTRKYAPR